MNYSKVTEKEDKVQVPNVKIKMSQGQGPKNVRFSKNGDHTEWKKKNSPRSDNVSRTNFKEGQRRKYEHVKKKEGTLKIHDTYIYIGEILGKIGNNFP